MDLREMEFFLAVASQGNLRRAAIQLGVTQPAVTKAIKRLEDQLGTPLFDRHPNGMRLNHFGACFLRDAESLVRRAGEAANRVKDLKKGIHGTISVGAGPFWQDAILPDAIREMRLEMPNIMIKVVGGSDDTLREMLRRGNLDFALAAGPDSEFCKEPSLQWDLCVVDTYSVISDINHPIRSLEKITIDDLTQYPWVMPNKNSYISSRMIATFESKSNKIPHIYVETDNINLKFAIMIGSNYLSYHANAHLSVNSPETITAIPIDYMDNPRKAGIWTRRDVSLSSSANRLMAIIKRCSQQSGSPSPR